MIDWKRWDQYQQTMTLWHWGLVVVAVSVAVWLIIRLKSFFREDADDTDQTLEMLTQFRDLHQEGGLSDDEFRLIRSRLAHSAKDSLVAKVATRDNTLPANDSADIAEDNCNNSTHTPAADVTAKDDSTSERMTDELTD